MLLIDTGQRLDYELNNGLKISGNLKQLTQVTEMLQEAINFQRLKEINGLKDTYYESQSMGVIDVTDMADEHLKNALLKKVREYYSREHFKEKSLEETLAEIDFVKSHSDDDLDLLYKELVERVTGCC